MNSLNLAYTSEKCAIPESICLPATQEKDEDLQQYLDTHFALSDGSHSDVAQYRIYFGRLLAHLKSGICVGLDNPGAFVEYGGDKERPSFIALAANHQSIELHFE